MDFKYAPESLKHLAVIMDGNRRWSVQQGVDYSEGYQIGAENAKKMIELAIKYRIPALTLYVLSAENWSRPTQEIDELMRLFSYYLVNKLELIHEHNVRLRPIGDLSRLPPSVALPLADLTDKSKGNQALNLQLAISYGGKQEIVDTCNKLILAGNHPITIEQFENQLYTAGLPEVDLVIRTGGNKRLSNFLLWQTAYAELYFCDKYWPDFNEEDLLEILADFASRSRSFGGTLNTLEHQK